MLAVWIIILSLLGFVAYQLNAARVIRKYRRIHSHERVAIAKNILLFSSLAWFFFWGNRGLDKIHTTVEHGHVVRHGLSPFESQLFLWVFLGGVLGAVVLAVVAKGMRHRWERTYGKALREEHGYSLEGMHTLERLGVLFSPFH